MLLAPPLLLYALAQAGILNHGETAAFISLAAAWAAGIAAILTSGWRLEVRLMVGAAYSLAAVLALPYLGLLAVCTTGDCI